MVAQGRIARQQLVAAQQQLREVHHALPGALFVVGGVELLHAPRDLVVRLDLRRAQAFLLVGRDEPLHLPGRVALLVDVEALEQPLDERELVLGVEDLEELREPRLAVVCAQQPVAQAVKGADPHAAGVDRQHRRDARQHFLRRLVGEGDRDEAARAHLPGLDQPRNARGEHARLAAAGAGEDQRRLVRQRDRFELLFIEAGEKIRGHDRRGGNRSDENRRTTALIINELNWKQCCGLARRVRL
jgi:hypothetical protein